MTDDLDIFITNYIEIDPEIFALWIQGHNAREAVGILIQRGISIDTGVPPDILSSDVCNHYRTYAMMEPFISSPSKFEEQSIFQLRPQIRRRLVEQYYDLDDNVVRELIGKKLSSKTRKDLDEVSERSGVKLRSCRRQFDNIKRIFKCVEDMQGVLLDNIGQQFQLPKRIAAKYVCVVFLACGRFEYGKRRLQHLPFECWKTCTQCIIGTWTCRGSSGGSAGVEPLDDTEFDKDFLMDLRDLKALQDKDRDHKQLVMNAIRGRISARNAADLEQNFTRYGRCILMLALNLHRHTKTLFLELMNIVDVFKQTGATAPWPRSDVAEFLDIWTSCGSQVDVIRESPNLKFTWEKYMKVVTDCTLAMYV